MWDKFMWFVKGLFGIKREDLKSVAGELKISREMWDAMHTWLAVFYNDPEWGRNNKTHLTKFAGVLTGYAATLATNEIKLGIGKSARGAFIEDQLKRFALNDIRTIIQKAAAGGYVVLKPYVYGANIYTDVTMPDNFFPTRIQGNTTEAGFFTYAAHVGDKKYIRMEFHDLQPDGVHIRNEAYEEHSIIKGRAVPLATVPEWAKILPEYVVTGAKRPLYAILKMPFANQVDPASKLPVSLYAQAMGSLREIDRIFTEFLWEIKSGKRKQIIDETAVQTMPGARPERKEGEKPRRESIPGYYTKDQYLVLNMGKNATKLYDDYTPEMRIEKYQLALNIQLRLMEAQCQLSAETFTFDIKTGEAKTATEVVSKDTETYNTIKTIQENGLKQGLLDLVEIYNIYTDIYSLAPGGTIDPSVEFGDSIFEDTNTEFMRRKSLVNDKIYRPDLLLSWYFGVDEKTAKEMMPEQVDPMQLPFANQLPQQSQVKQKKDDA